ncbi:MAG: GTPase Era [Deltaproteobacteria bacterium RIFOXYD12_FULL_57_12]|nr:MAG: GTPase Era [Deltaproteobacteria bacterium RIFOXYD12_FULL_57_12]
MLSEQNALCKSGMVAIIGPPNAGKSTLMNSLLGQKISIVTPKPQTTRNRILGIMNEPAYQIVLLDTPGLHRARLPLNQEMVKNAVATLTDVDLLLFLVDISLPMPEKQASTLSFLEDVRVPAILVMNKIDLVKKELLLPMIEVYRTIYPFTAIIPVSALHNMGTADLVKEMLERLPIGPRLYPEDIPTDATERFIVAEIIREKIFLQTSQEVPYATAVMIDAFQEDEAKGMTTIHATIIVEKGSQKGIIIGKGGSRLTKIGSDARRDIEALLGQRVLLKLWVKVKKNWTSDLRMLRELGVATG